MSIITCRFCRREGPKAKEHIWPKWLQKKVYGSTNWSYSGTHTFFYALPISNRRHTGENLVLGDICKVCNNGWMNEFETRFKLILEKVLENKASLFSLNRVEREDIIKWAFKTAIVINAGTNYRKIVPDGHFHHLNDFRYLPKNVKVDVGLIESDEKLRWVQAPLMFAHGRESHIKNNYNLLRNNNYCIAMQIYHLGLRVTWYEDLKQQDYKLEPTSSEKTLRIWPFERNSQLDKKKGFKDIEEFHTAIMLKLS